MQTQSTSLVFIYFIYGLAFFSMGLAVWLEAGRSSEFQNIRPLRFLAGFGILHGLHEWVEVFTILHNAGVVALGTPFLANIVDVALLLFSFVLLLMFGMLMVFAGEEGNGRNRTFITVLIIFIIWAVATAIALSIYKPCREGCMDVADVLGRYLLGIPGALLAAWAMLIQRRSFKARGMIRCAKDIRWAALALFVYGVVGQVFTKQTPLFPSTIINTDLFLQLFGFPVQILRAVMACAVAIFIIRALRAFELERQARLVTANAARLVAQQEALLVQQKAQAETDALNQELQTAVQNLTTLFDLSHNLAMTLDQEAIFQRTLPQICDSIPRIAQAVIFMRQDGQRPLQSIMCHPDHQPQNGSGPKSLPQPIGQLAEHVCMNGGPACWLDGRIMPLDPAEFQVGPDSGQRYGRIIGLPLVIKEQISGSLVLSLHDDAEAASLADLSLFCTIVRQMSLAIENATLYQEVQAREERRGELLHQVVNAQEAERQHIARELHDGLGQMLTALSLGLTAARDSLANDPERSARQLTELKKMGTQVLHELQSLVSGLRPSTLDDLGLVPALRSLLSQFEQTGMTVRLQIQGHTRRIQPEIETVLFRIAQESLTNAARHAQADSVQLMLTFAADSIALQVQDDGIGFDLADVLRVEQRKHWGLVGIEERVSLVGGKSQIYSQPGAGTTILVTIPLQEEPVHA